MNAPDLFDRLADETATHYEAYVGMLAGSYHAAVEGLAGGALHATHVGAAVASRAIRAVFTAIVLPGVHAGVARAAKEGAIAAGAVDVPSETRQVYQEAATAALGHFARHDANTAQRKIRELSMRYELARRTMAPPAAQLAATGQLKTDAFSLLDRAGRAYKSVDFVRQAMRGWMVLAYADGFVETLMQDHFQIVDGDETTEVSVLGDGEHSWGALRDSLHPNTRATLRPVPKED
jgi:hypothetical protein